MEAVPRGVMVVDDDADVREALAMTLELHGYLVLLAKDGAEALTLLRGDECRPCLILLDLMMPRMSGLEFRTEQLLDPCLAAIPVVVVTGAGRGVDQAALSGVGLEVITKPVSVDGLLEWVRRFCTP